MCMCVTGVSVCMSVLGIITHSLCICHLAIKLFCIVLLLLLLLSSLLFYHIIAPQNLGYEIHISSKLVEIHVSSSKLALNGIGTFTISLLFSLSGQVQSISAKDDCDRYELFVNDTCMHVTGPLVYGMGHHVAMNATFYCVSALARGQVQQVVSEALTLSRSPSLGHFRALTRASVKH